MTGRLRVLTALEEDPDLVPRAHVVTHTYQSIPRGPSVLLWPPSHGAHMCVCRQPLKHIKKINLFFVKRASLFPRTC